MKFDALLRRMIYETGTEDLVADAVRLELGWRCSDTEARRRLMQMLGEYTQRHFPARCIPIVFRLVAEEGGINLLEGPLYRAWHEGEMAHEERQSA